MSRAKFFILFFFSLVKIGQVPCVYLTLLFFIYNTINESNTTTLLINGSRRIKRENHNDNDDFHYNNEQ